MNVDSLLLSASWSQLHITYANLPLEAAESLHPVFFFSPPPPPRPPPPRGSSFPPRCLPPLPLQFYAPVGREVRLYSPPSLNGCYSASLAPRQRSHVPSSGPSYGSWWSALRPK